MTLADKRKVIEVLLAGGDEVGGLRQMFDADRDAVMDPGYWKADHCRQDVGEEMPDDIWEGLGYQGRCLEAAYRLIESSAKLRREWFGAP